MRKRIAAALLCVCLLVPALTAPALAAFPDVPADEWYTEYVDLCAEKGIVNGFEDGTFRPTGYLRRSEFIKMLAASASLSYKSELPGRHWAEQYWAMLSENGVLEGLDIPCTFDALQKNITRYEMAVMIRNFLAKVRGETEAVTNGAAREIPDWAYIPEAYRGAVAQVYAKGIINGMGDGTFAPNKTMTRAEFCTITVKALGLNPKANSTFSDVSATDWYAGYVGTASDKGIVNGVGNNKFNPEGTITRQEAATMVARAAKALKLDTGVDNVDEVMALFTDGTGVESWAKDAVAYCCTSGIAVWSGSLQPTKAILRCEIAQMIYNMLNLAGEL